MDVSTWRYTRKNPVAGNNKPTYRIPYCTEDMFREDKFMGSRVILGKVADALGKYEDIGSIEEILAMQQELKTLKGNGEAYGND